ncbi:MAG: diguanylate cyclase, partial [Terriglobales bacterium]
MESTVVGMVVVPGVTALLLLLVFTYLYRQSGAAYFRAWQLGWAFYVLHFALQGLVLSGVAVTATNGLAKAALVATALSICVSTRLIGQEFHLRWQDAVLALAGAGWAVLDAMAQAAGSPTMLAAGNLVVPHVEVEVGVAALLVVAAVRLFPLARKRDSMAFRLLSMALGLWAALLLMPQFAGLLEAASLGNVGRYLGPLPQTLVGIAMVMAMYEDERRAVQENLLAFTKLDVDTDRPLEAAELAPAFEEMLSRLMKLLAAERAMLVSVPQWQRTLPSVARGFSTDFGGRLQRSSTGEGLSSILAGRSVCSFLSPRQAVAGLPEAEAERASVLVQALDREKVGAFTVASLHTHEQKFGVLLLPHAESGLGAPQMRLLTGLVAQISLTLENYILMHDAHRRARELELLTHIGQVVSSRLDPDEVLLAVQRELGRIFNTQTFSVVFQFGQQVRFELEVVEGEVLPKRTRPVANGLFEHIILTGEPLLVPSGMEEKQAELKLQRSDRPAKSFCGVPIIMYGRAVGMMAAMHHSQEYVYEQRDVVVMTTAAGQVAVAIENARLFAEEQRRARYLAFLNNISKTAISSQNAEEMLAEIVREIQKNFLYDHIGIGILDYASKDIEIKAEAGRTAKALGKRVPLGAGILGRVARTNEMALVQNTGEGHLLGILPESKSVLCIPVTYSETLLGVLNVESQRESAFGEQDVLILRTLADLLATALHNAFVFQKMQHQSITDGLTGIKTRRFFMEALQSEWKRASRSGRPFSVVLLDLDKFKQVNDSMGHLEGDLVLARVGRLLEQKCRQSNVVARYGGDEFMILMPETGVEQAQILSERLRLWLATDPMLNERKVTGSFGVSTFPLHGATVEDVVRVADAGMYVSKHNGGNRVSTAEEFVEGESRPHRQLVNRYIEGFLRRESVGPESAGELVATLESLAAEAGEADRVEVLMNA